MLKKRSLFAFIFIVAFIFSIGVCSNPIPASAYAVTPDGLHNYWSYYIKSDRSGKYLEVANNSLSDGALVQQNDFTGADNQKWMITNMGDNEYKITPASAPNKALTVLAAYNTMSGAIGIRTYSGANNQLFGIANSSDGYSFILRPAAYGFNWAAVISGGSCADEAKLIHYPYSGTSNEEFLFIPADFVDNELAQKYAAATYAAANVATPYPYLNVPDTVGTDCVNFVSQCLLQKGIHEREEWFVYAKNVNHPAPQTIAQLDSSWELETRPIDLFRESSPWISARVFDDFWIDKVDYHSDYDAIEISRAPVILYNSPYYIGDVFCVLMDDNPAHVGMVTSYINDPVNGMMTLGISSHTQHRHNYSIAEVARYYIQEYPNSEITIRMYRFTFDVNSAPAD